MSYYAANRALNVFAYGQSNAVAKPHFTPANDPPNYVRLTDERITVWNDVLEQWVVADPTAADGTETPGGSGLLIPQIALQAMKHGAQSFKFVSIARSAKDVHEFDPGSPLLIESGLNRWNDGLSKVARSGLEPEVMLGYIGEGDGSTVLTGVQIKAHHEAIIAAAVEAWPSLRRVVLCVPAVRMDYPPPPGTQPPRGHMLRALMEIGDEQPKLVRVVDLARWDLRTYSAQWPHQTYTEYGEIAGVVEPEMRL